MLRQGGQRLGLAKYTASRAAARASLMGLKARAPSASRRRARRASPRRTRSPRPPSPGRGSEDLPSPRYTKRRARARPAMGGRDLQVPAVERGDAASGPSANRPTAAKLPTTSSPPGPGEKRFSDPGEEVAVARAVVDPEMVRPVRDRVPGSPPPAAADPPRTGPVRAPAREPSRTRRIRNPTSRGCRKGCDRAPAAPPQGIVELERRGEVAPDIAVVVELPDDHRRSRAGPLDEQSRPLATSASSDQSNTLDRL